MNIFYKRPLSLILCVLLGAFVLSAIVTGTIRAIICILAAAVLLVGVILYLFKKRRSLFISTLAALFAIGVLLSYLYFEVHFDVASRLTGEVAIEGHVETVERRSDYSADVVVKVSALDGKRSDTKVLLRLSDEHSQYARTGSRISLKGSLDPINSTDDFDARSYYYARGIAATVEEYSQLLICDGETPSLSGAVELLNVKISRHIVLAFGEEAGGFFAAVFMGNKSFLSPELELNFRRIGISHILALSGMHLAILAAGATRLLSLMGISKKPRCGIMMLLILSYMALTGFSVSVVRAGIMLIVSYLLYLLASVKDSLTNLAISVTVICMIEPYAIFDVSLWLSALATLGIVVMSESTSIRTRGKPILIRILIWSLISLLSSFFAISATIAVSVAFSGTVSLLSALSTMIFSLLVEIFIYLGLLILIPASFFPIGEFVMTPLSRLISLLADSFSDIGAVVLSAEGTPTRIAIWIFTVLFFVFLVFKIKHRRAAFGVLLSFFALVHVFAMTDTYSHLYDDDILYTATEGHDLIAVKTNGNVAVLDIGTYNASMAFETASVLNGERIFDIEAHVISHYSFGLSDYLDELYSLVKVETLFVPVPENGDEEVIYKILAATLDDHGIKMEQYSLGHSIMLGDSSISEIHRELYGESTMKNAFYVSLGENTVSYLGSGMLYYDTRDTALRMMTGSDTVLFGAHGKTYYPVYKFYTVFDGIGKIVIANDSIRVSNNATVKYKEKGTEILTDPGTVSLIH